MLWAQPCILRRKAPVGPFCKENVLPCTTQPIVRAFGEIYFACDLSQEQGGIPRQLPGLEWRYRNAAVRDSYRPTLGTTLKDK